MKMMRRTSMMSTSGVTLMPWMPSSVSNDAAAISGRLLVADRRRDHVRDELAAEAFGADRARLQDALEVVERGDGRQRDHEAHRGRDQRLGDAGHDLRAVARRAREVRGGIDDAEHG